MYVFKNNSYGVNKNIGYTNKKNNINFGVNLKTNAKMKSLKKTLLNSPIRPEYSRNITFFDLIETEVKIFNAKPDQSISQFLNSKPEIKEKIITFLDQVFDIQLIRNRESKNKVNEKVITAIDYMLDKNSNYKTMSSIAYELKLDYNLLSALNKIPTRYKECREHLKNKIPSLNQFKKFYDKTHHYNFIKIKNKDNAIKYFVNKYNASKKLDSNKLIFKGL